MDLKELLIKHNFRFNKALGQNFISDVNLLDAIIGDSGVSEDDTVVEIGAGAGTLTQRLSLKAKRVVAFEVDENLKAVLQDGLNGLENVTLVFKDVLRMRDAEIAELTDGVPFKVVANLPYYVTTDMVMRFLESRLDVSSVTVMVQREVADRFTALPATPEYGAITMGINIRGNAKKMRDVPRTVFYPVPNVDSAVVRIDTDKNKFDGENLPFISALAKTAFRMRRKTFVNNLTATFKVERAEAEAALAACGIQLMARGETLHVDDIVRLSRVLKQK
ncbi:MAG: 16S rRNA (adenine(1518)-N(6)/adenine(1519)-N(6))-dimethyltransferase RsmA [Clostridiaceae bacterium]|jgi:16S rRNA (adenine1518-N6/adenine1519-N6)-dimethyltransferase|nr:16S rRNA (adenine(1518)-N(6)/adenine(1519)-N(6))-dimethyltransferase RsmA [Clostridiaceae bacterium]